jgi:glycosyltransferase involved in cell wall biosynthesis
LRILHVIPSFNFKAGGPVVALSGLACAQARAGLDVTVLTCFEQESDRDQDRVLTAANVRVEWIGPVHGALRRATNLNETVARLVANADIIHVHGLWEEVQHQAMIIARAHKIPYVITPHGMLTRWSLGQKKWKKLLYRFWRLSGDMRSAAAVHFITSQERNQSRGQYQDVKAIVEPIGIDLAEFQTLPPRGSFRGRHAIASQTPLIVFLGRIHPGKGLEHLIPAMPMVAGATLAVVGPDSSGYRASIERQIRELGIESRVIFTGMLNGADKIAALVDADIFCLPSDHENFGLAVLESLAAGTPVVISPEVAISDEIGLAEVGAVVVRQPALLAAELSRWLMDAGLRQRAAALCREFAFTRFDWNAIASRWVEHYRAMR